MKTGCKAYETINTMSMSQLDLILAVYSGAVGYLEQAKEAFGESNFDRGRAACDRARKCVVHLYTTLDMDRGKEIARHLGHLYAYMIEQIDLAVASKSLQRINDVIGVLNTVKEGWEGLKGNKEKAARPDQPQVQVQAELSGEPSLNSIVQPSERDHITVSG
jgi:flagellar protein FliS